MKKTDREKNRRTILQVTDLLNEKLRHPGYQLLFVFLCVAVSRLMIVLAWAVWNSRTGQETTFFEAFSRYDTDWYKSIITEGYSPEPNAGDKMDSANWAFFPFMPIVMRLLHFILPLDLDLLAFLFHSLFFAAALVIAFRYILEFRGRMEQAVLFTMLMSFGVYNFYFSLLYTESMFFLFTVIFFYAMRKKKYLLMGIVGAMASATRTIGIMLVFAVAVQYTMDFFSEEWEKKEGFFPSVKRFFIHFFGNIRLVLGTVLIPFGLFAYMLYLRILTGDTLAFVHIQIAWGKREAPNPVKILFDSLTNVESGVFYLSLWTLFGIYAFWILIQKKHWQEAAVCALFVLIPLSTGIIAMPRYVIGCFLPMLGFTDDASQWTADKKVLLMAGSILFHFICLTGWFNGAAYVM